jgi:hypothetical protein
MLSVAIKPEASETVAVNVFPPSIKGTSKAMKPPPEMVAATPLTATAVADSLTLPTTRVVVLAIVERSAGSVIATLGKIRRLTLAVTSRLLPAMSVARTTIWIVSLSVPGSQ